MVSGLISAYFMLNVPLFSLISLQLLQLLFHLEFYVSVKLGKGQERDELGRFYTYFNHDELEEILGQSGFEIVDKFTGKAKVWQASLKNG